MSHPPANPPRASAWTSPLVGVAAAVSILAVLTQPGLFMVDDAWFYLQIARNLALSGQSTFDGSTFTNGYHPLWMALVTAVGFVTGGARTPMLYGSLALQVVMAASLLAFLPRIAAREGFAYPTFVMTAFVLTQLTDQGWMSEGMLTGALHVAVLWSWTRADRPWRTGLLLGLLFLARLDTLFLIVAIGLFTLPDVRRTATMAAMAAVPVLPWLLWTFLSTGHLVPVSGAIKSVFPVPDFSDPVGKLGWIGIGTALGSVVGLGLALRFEDPRKRRLLGALALGAVMHATYVTLFTAPRWSTFVAYYWITGTLASGLVLGEALHLYLGLLPSLASRRPALAGFVISVLAASGAARAVRSVAIAPEVDSSVELARWVGQAHPEAVLLVLDAPGRTAWFSGLPVVASDGLTQDYDFATQVAEQGMPAWAHERGITHVFSYAVPFSLPWGRIETDGDLVHVTFIAPGLAREAGTMTLSEPLKRLSDFDPTGDDMAALYPLPVR